VKSTINEHFDIILVGGIAVLLRGHVAKFCFA
jgi:hypothetical protein